MGRRWLLFLTLLLLALPAAFPAEAQEVNVPQWRVGDRWDYKVSIVSQSGTTSGNMVVKVTASGTVTVGNESIPAYTLAVSRRERGSGLNTTYTITKHVAKATLCTIYMDYTQVITYGDLESEVHSSNNYYPSDGRYSFPLGAGLNWSAGYSLNRTILVGTRLRNESTTVLTPYSCEVREGLSVSGGMYMSYRVRCTPDDTGNYSYYWYSDKARGDVKMEEFNRATQALTTIQLTKYYRAPEAPPLLGPDTERALILLGAAFILLAVMAVVVYIRSRPPKIPPPPTAEEQGSAAFQFVKTRDGYSMKLNTVDLVCPSCRKRFRVVVTSTTAKCPHCGKEGRRT